MEGEGKSGKVRQTAVKCFGPKSSGLKREVKHSKKIRKNSECVGCSFVDLSERREGTIKKRCGVYCRIF